MDNQFIEEPKCLTERFVEALSLETQTGEIRWRFKDQLSVGTRPL